MKTFAECIEERNEIDLKVDLYTKELREFKRSASGLINDKTKKTQTFIKAQNNFVVWFKKLQEINIFINRNYKKESREYRLLNRDRKIN